MQTGLPPKVLACEPGTQFMISALRHADAERHAGRDAFGDADDVGLDAGVLDGPPLSGSADAGLDLVGDEQDAVPVADAADLLEEVVGRDDVAAFALDGLEDDGGDFFGREDGFEELVFDVAGAVECEGLLSAGPPVVPR